MNYLERLKNAIQISDRIEIARDSDCDVRVLEILITQDVEFSVIEAAKSNPNCTTSLIEIANKRLANFSQNNTMCPIPWTHIAIQQNGDYRVCCQSIYPPFSKLISDDQFLNVKNTSITDARNHEVFKNIRVKMLKGERPSECTLCYKEEDLGLKSKRKFMLQKYRIDQYAKLTADDGTINSDKFPLRYIDIRFGNLCNLKCRYCGPTDSSLWYEDFPEYANRNKFNFYGQQTYEIVKKNKTWTLNSLDFEWHEEQKFWDAIVELLPYIDRYYFTGGEPTINKAHYNLLQLIIDRNLSEKVTLEYNSNMVAIPDKLYDQWKKFNRVEIGCSIDGIGEYANYLRYPSDWKNIESNLDKLGNFSRNIVGGISTTVNVYNILNFLDLSMLLAQKKYRSIKRIPSFHILESPNEMSIQVLPLETKQKTIQLYDSFYDNIETTFGKKLALEYKNAYNGILNYMMAEDKTNLLPTLARDTYKLDQIRGQNIENIIPWLSDILKTFK